MKKTTSGNDLEKLLAQKTAKQYGSTSSKRGGGAVIYTRVSSSEQAQNNGSLEVQKKLCEDFCLKNQLAVIDYFGGTFESAKSDGRKEFQRMLEFVNKNKAVSFIVVFNLDRFSRTGSAAAHLSEELRTKGVVIRSVTQDIDTSTAIGRLSENFFHLLNNFDNRLKSDRTKINTREVMLKGYWPYSTPLGYENLKKKQRACFHEYVITEAGKEIKKAFQLKAEGRLTNKEIIERLNAKGVKMTKSNFQLVIANPFYAGYVTGNLVEGKLIKGKHPALVDLQTFLKANEMLGKAPGKNIPKKNRHDELPLKTFIKDELSNQPLTGYKTKGHWYYKVKEAEIPMNIRADKLNELFVTNLSQFEYNRKFKSKIKEQLLQRFKELSSSTVEENKLLRKQLTEKERQLESMEERYVTGSLTSELYEKYARKFKTEIDQISAQLSNSVIDSSNLKTGVEKALEIAENLSQLWVSASFEDKQLLQHLIFPDGAVYSKQKHEVRTERVNTIFNAIAEQTRVSGENKNGDSSKNRQKSTLVPRTGFEPARPFGHHHLKVACLPISTPGRNRAANVKCLPDLIKIFFDDCKNAASFYMKTLAKAV